jgi:hypothetical protein
LEPKKDMFGNNLELFQNAKNNFLNIAINPAIVTKYKADPEAKKMLDVYQMYKIKDQIPSPAPKTFTIKKKDYPSLTKDEVTINLTPKEYSFYQEEYGKGVKELLKGFEVVDNKDLQQKRASELSTKYNKLRDRIEKKIIENRGIN